MDISAIWTMIWALTLAVGVSFFCSVSEAAFYAVTDSYVNSLSDDSKTETPLQLIKNDMDRYIASILILNTLANTLGVYFAGSAAVSLFADNSLIITAFPILMTLIILFLAELIPKTLGVKYNRKLAPILAFPFVWITRILSILGLIRLSLMITNIVTRKEKDEDKSTTLRDSSEIQSLSAMIKAEGGIDDRQHDVIQNIIDLDNRSVSKILTPRKVVFTQHPDTTIQESLDNHGIWKFSRVPIVDEDGENILGIALRHDIMSAQNEGKEDQKMRDIMRKALIIPSVLSVSKLLTRFLTTKQHICIVVDEYGGFCGIVTLEDVLEELLGTEIVDETDMVVDMQEKARKESAAFLQMSDSQLKDEESPAKEQ